MSKFIPRSRVQADRIRQVGIQKTSSELIASKLWPDPERGPLFLNAREYDLIKRMNEDDREGLRASCMIQLREIEKSRKDAEVLYAYVRERLGDW